MSGMQIHVLAIGRARGDPAQAMFDDYSGRLPWPLTLREIAPRGNFTGPELMTREGLALLEAVPKGSLMVVLDGTGSALTSEAFAARMGRWQDEGTPSLAFLIGGADGHASKVLKAADFILSLGAMTWPHKLVRAMLAEQLWRAASILANHPYHRA